MKNSCLLLPPIVIVAVLMLTSCVRAQTVNFWFSLQGSASVLTNYNVTQGQPLDLSLWYQTDDSFPHNAIEVVVGYDTTTQEGALAVPLDNQIALVDSPNINTTLFDCVLLNDIGGGYSPSGGIRPYGAHMVISKLAGTVIANVPTRIADLTIRNQGMPAGASYTLTVYDAASGDRWTSAIAQGTTTRRDATMTTLNIHSIAAQPISISDAKEFADGAFVSCAGKIVTALFADRFYIEESDRYSGIRVTIQGYTVQVGDTVNVSGFMATDPATGERFIDATNGTVSVAGG